MTEIKVEVRPMPGGGDLGPRSIVLESFASRIDEISECLHDIAVKLSRRLDESFESGAKDWRLSEVEVKFSLDLEAEAGVVIARARTTAGFEATLSWKNTQNE